MLKRSLIFLCGLFLCLNIFAATPLNRIIAIVNNDVITQVQLNRKVVMIKEQLKRAGTKIPSDVVLRKQVLEQYIDQLLQVQAAERTGLRISNSELNAQINRMAKANHISLDKMYKSIQHDGWTIKEFRNEIRQELLVHKLQSRDIAPRISISQQEVDNFLNITLNKSRSMPEYHLQGILIALPPTPSPAEVSHAKGEAQTLIYRLKKGEDFQKLAATYSNDKYALKGGNMGWKKLAALPLSIANKIKSMTIDQIVGPIETSSGFYVIKLLGERESLLPNTIEQTEARIIFLPHSFKNAVQQLNDLRLRAKKGEKFSDLAVQYSKDSKTAKEGGYAGWITTKQYGTTIYNALRQLKTGDISTPMATRKGYYLIQVIAKRRIAKSSVAQRRQVEQLIFQRKLTENLRNFINQLHGNAYIKIFK